jgi:hypothetical protein
VAVNSSHCMIALLFCVAGGVLITLRPLAW